MNEKKEVNRVYTNLEDFKNNDSKAWKALLDAADIDESNPNEFDDITTLEGVIELIKEMDWGDEEESVDSCYINQDYVAWTDDKSWGFRVTGSSYRKDQCVCEEKMLQEITVIDTNLKKQLRTERKLKEATEDLEKWNSLFEGKSFEEVKAILIKLKFPLT